VGLEAYEVGELLFEAPPSTFYRARNAVLGSEVMLRRLAIDPARSADVRATFFREMRLSAAIRHPGIQRPIDVFEQDGSLWSVHEVRSLEPTSDLVRERGPLPIATAARLGAQAADALAHVHAMGHVHGRITPRTIVLEERGNALLINLVKAADLAAGIWPLREVVLGLSPYTSPDEFHGARPSASGDLHALAATIFFWLTGRPPRGGNSPEEQLARAREGRPAQDLREACPDAPPVLAARIAAALAPDAASRHGSVAALGSLLSELHQRHAAETPAGFAPGSVVAPTGCQVGVEILGRHGAGAFGIVFKARLSGGDTTLAVKALKPEHRDDPQALERFLREARALQQVSDPHVVGIRGVGERGGIPFVVMDFVAGPDLATLLVREGPLPAARAARLGAGIARGLAAIHREGIVHRDLKPHNVLVAPQDHAVIADFGIARRDGATRLTQTGQLAGTPLYMAPELFLGEPAAAPADVYSLGTILFELLTGSVPFPAEDALTAITAIRERPTPRLPAPVPEPLADLVHRLLGKEPEARPTASEAAGALEGVAGG